jgi:hypothetical protein
MSENEHLDKLDKLANGIPDSIPLARAEWRTVPILVAAMSFATLVFSMVVVVYAAWEAREARVRVQRAAECIIEQFAEHRAANEAAHKAVSEKVGTGYVLGRDPPPVVLDRLREACAPFERGGKMP